MTKELVCIVCPRSCRMTITSDGDELVVTGNTCKRGKEFAVSEMTDPRRTVCTNGAHRLPFGTGSAVRVSGRFPKQNFRPDARGKPYHRFKTTRTRGSRCTEYSQSRRGFDCNKQYPEGREEATLKKKEGKIFNGTVTCADL